MESLAFHLPPRVCEECEAAVVEAEEEEGAWCAAVNEEGVVEVVAVMDDDNAPPTLREGVAAAAAAEGTLLFKDRRAGLQMNFEREEIHATSSSGSTTKRASKGAQAETCVFNTATDIEPFKRPKTSGTTSLRQSAVDLFSAYLNDLISSDKFPEFWGKGAQPPSKKRS